MNQEFTHNNSSNTQRVLTAFYSHSGNTRECAREIHKQVGGDLFEIETVEPYPKAYSAVTQQAKEELSRGYLPNLRQQLENIDQYDVLLLGSPNWWSTIAPPVRTFLSLHDFSGKCIAPFITHGGGGLARCSTDIAKLCPNATVLKALSIMGQQVAASHNEISVWLNESNLKQEIENDQ